jgi:PPOX class probable F420-dependent enzyme
MSALTLGETKIQSYLATKDVALLATINPDGSPLAMPMWFLPDPDAITMISVDGLAKVRNLKHDPRVCVIAESGGRGDIKGVAVRGRAEFLNDSPLRRRLIERLLTKYDPHLAGLWKGREMPANRVIFRIVPQHVRSWGLG